MRDFYAQTAAGPLDQADGLRRLFGGNRQRFIALAANPHVAFSGVALERLASAFVARGRSVLVVDAADDAPRPSDIARIDLGLAIERLSASVGYLAARDLPLAYVDTRGTAGGFLDALAAAAPEADAIVVHANPSQLARVFMRRATRPLLLASDHPESVKHAYAACKLLARRCSLLTFDLLLAADPNSPRLPAIVGSLAGCADNFLGALLREWVVVDPAADVGDAPGASLLELADAQLALDDTEPALPAGLHAPRRASASVTSY